MPPVSTWEPASITIAASTNSTIQLNQPLGESHKQTKAFQHENQQEQFPRSGDVPLQQAPAVFSAASLDSTSVQVETSSPFLSSAAIPEKPVYLLEAAEGLLELCSQSWANESPGGKKC
jgi:hypothetical protein